MRTSSNPAFRNLPVGGAAGGSYGFGQPQQALGQAGPEAATGVDERPITVDDIVLKTGACLGTALGVGVITAIWAQTQIAAGTTGGIFGAMIGGMLVGLVLALIIIFKKLPSPALTLAYSAAQGVFLGAITGMFTAMFGNQIALNAILGTAGVFAVMLVVYRTGAVKVTPKFTKWIIGAIGGAFILMLANLVLGFFGINMGLRDGGTLAIIFSLVVIGIAAFSFLLDFDMADRMIREAVPAKWAWFVAFGLMVTLVWLYLEILRLLSYFQE
ncbi:Bax inhibitor-1/YccA family protein [Haloechinothrix sp. LS1_15]|uniref:Bax inhibitor-1/YccA family protein n=1 Tax=Haloechinothrix sp. LS1_15 TaxID=2652248 RepID=UPI002946554F|nr:Bax inhibitor-1/YccA family protein [Haloechinothrix sp. LS1_15]MDV6011509.1 Bax inhibitor-1/YccA family protein [Haloechinothrix sp. LS1_15]